MNHITDLLNLTAGQAVGSEIPEHEVVIRTAGLKSVAMGHELLSQGLCVSDDLLGVGLE